MDNCAVWYLSRFFFSWRVEWCSFFGCFVFCLPGSSSCSSPARLPFPPPFLLLLSSKEDRLGENSFCNRLHKTTGSEVSSEFETAPAENTGEAVLEAACDGANEAPLEVTKTRYMQYCIMKINSHSDRYKYVYIKVQYLYQSNSVCSLILYSIWSDHFS